MDKDLLHHSEYRKPHSIPLRFLNDLRSYLRHSSHNFALSICLFQLLNLVLFRTSKPPIDTYPLGRCLKVNLILGCSMLLLIDIKKVHDHKDHVPKILEVKWRDILRISHSVLLRLFSHMLCHVTSMIGFSSLIQERITFCIEVSPV